jgi:hypothetical protein
MVPQCRECFELVTSNVESITWLKHHENYEMISWEQLETSNICGNFRHRKLVRMMGNK